MPSITARPTSSTPPPPGSAPRTAGPAPRRAARHFKVFGSGKSATPRPRRRCPSGGRYLGVIGTRAGKSTLIRLVNGLESPTSGSVLLNGTDIAGMKEKQLRAVRRDIGMIFQQFNLFTSRTVAGNVAYPLELAGMGRAERKARVAELLEFVGLGDRGDSYPEQLSGGQKQRVGIARALATNPSLLLADEATSALDPETTADVLELLREVNRTFGVTIVLITHEMSVVRAIADHVAVMENGRVERHGPRSFAHPTTGRRRLRPPRCAGPWAGADSALGSLGDAPPRWSPSASTTTSPWAACSSRVPRGSTPPSRVP